RRPGRPAAARVVGDAAGARLLRPLQLLLVSDLPGPRHPDRGAGAEHARRQPPARPRSRAPVTEPPVLDVRDLAIEFPRHREPIVPVRGVSFALQRRQRLGIVGESGSGKSLTALGLMRLLPPPGRIAAGQILLGGRDLAALSEREMAAVRGRRLALVYQDPMSSLNPVHSVGRQIVEAIRTHEDVSRRVARARAIELLGDVRLPAPARRFDSYPHQFSGGMRQRVMIAMAISAGPDVLIADEPTTALDVTTQARIIDPLSPLGDEHGV